MRIDWPTALLSPNSFRFTSDPMNATRRCSRTSSSSRNRPPGQRNLGAHRPVGRRHGANQIRRLLRAEADRLLFHHLRAHRLDQRQLGELKRVLDGDAHAVSRALAARLHAGLAGPRDDDAAAEGVGEPRRQRVAEAVAVRQQHHDRDDAPRDAEHRQAGAEAVARPGRTSPRGTLRPAPALPRKRGRAACRRRQHGRLHRIDGGHGGRRHLHLVAERVDRRQLRRAPRRIKGRQPRR